MVFLAPTPQTNLQPWCVMGGTESVGANIGKHFSGFNCLFMVATTHVWHKSPKC